MTASERLCGLTLDEKWLVTEKLEMKPGETGSFFSIRYKVRSLADGKEYFLKALNLARAFQGPIQDLERNLKQVLDSWLFERETYEMTKRIRRIVKIVDHGQVRVDQSELGTVSYMVFEMAKCDIRSHLAAVVDGTYAWKLRALHNIASAILGLHKKGIAHQDVKPSNALKYDDDVKLGDLGSCSDLARPREADDALFAGDWSYIPPELALGHVHPGWKERRFGADFYLLGSLGMFLITQQTMNEHVNRQLDTLAPVAWGDSYEQVLPYLQFAINGALAEVRKHIEDPEIAVATVEILSELCNPNFEKRGLPKGIIELGSIAALEKYVSRLNQLARHAELSLRKKPSAADAVTIRT